MRQRSSIPISSWATLYFTIFLTFIFLFSSSSNCAAQKLSINAPTDPPLTTPQKDGLLDIIVGEAFRRIGITLEIIKLPAERALQNVNNGIDDGDLSRISGLEKHYPNLIRVPEKLFDMDFVVFTNNPNVISSDLKSISQFSIGLIRGWKILETKTEGMPNVTPVRNAEAMFNMLNKNRIDIALYARWMGTALSNKMNITNVHIIEPPLASKEMFMYLHKKHKALIPEITRSLQQIKQEGLYDKVFKEKLQALQQQ